MLCCKVLDMPRKVEKIWGRVENKKKRERPSRTKKPNTTHPKITCPKLSLELNEPRPPSLNPNLSTSKTSATWLV